MAVERGISFSEVSPGKMVVDAKGRVADECGKTGPRIEESFLGALVSLKIDFGHSAEGVSAVIREVDVPREAAL